MNCRTVTPDQVFCMAAIASGGPVDTADLAILTAEGLAVARHDSRAPELTARGLKAATQALADLSPLMQAVAFAADLTRQNLPDCADRIRGAA